MRCRRWETDESENYEWVLVHTDGSRERRAGSPRLLVGESNKACSEWFDRMIENIFLMQNN